MNGWSALSSIVGSIAIIVIIFILFGSDSIVDIIRAWKDK